jgi:hypothetical protein
VVTTPVNGCWARVTEGTAASMAPANIILASFIEISRFWPV